MGVYGAISTVMSSSVNVYMLTYNLLRSIPPGDQFIFNSVIASQFVLFALILVPYAVVNDSIRRSQARFPPLQWHLRKSVTKIRVLRLYEQITAKRQIGLSAGPLGAITKLGIIEVGG